ncbi:MAG: prepilin-type N-terminal cleavage/methylation domain-containing protein [Planctomycetes bacterium]|nr:prepilin-type N-terminal cleavage/methylation domain-containing protein [Planctomycetota bacterium]
MTSADPRQRRGFTIIELMVSIALAIVVVGVAYSGFRAALQAMRLSSEMSLRNKILSGTVLFACDAVDNRRLEDPPTTTANPDAPVRYNLRILREGSNVYNVATLPLPEAWPQPVTTILTRHAPAAIFEVKGIDCGQIGADDESSLLGQSAMLQPNLFFTRTPFGRDMPNAKTYVLKTLVAGSPDYPVSWFGARNQVVNPGDQAAAGGAWSGLAFGRKLTARRTNACVLELTDPETGSVQSISFQITAADAWSN